MPNPTGLPRRMNVIVKADRLGFEPRRAGTRPHAGRSASWHASHASPSRAPAAPARSRPARWRRANTTPARSPPAAASGAGARTAMVSSATAPPRTAASRSRSAASRAALRPARPASATPARSPRAAASSAGATTSSASSATAPPRTAASRSRSPAWRAASRPSRRADYHTCALTTGGGVQCWGLNSSGQLGGGTGTISSVPVAVSGLSSGVAAIAAGGFHTCALTTGGGVQCWGFNDNGQLGNGTTTDSSVPVAVSGASSDVAAIAAGAYHTCALTTDGGVQCWGFNDNGQLGNGTTTDSSVPVAVTGAVERRRGDCSGRVPQLQALHVRRRPVLGLRTAVASSATAPPRTAAYPVAVSGLASGVAAIAAGGFHTCALTTGGGVECWG